MKQKYYYAKSEPAAKRLYYYDRLGKQQWKPAYGDSELQIYAELGLGVAGVAVPERMISRTLSIREQVINIINDCLIKNIPDKMFSGLCELLDNIFSRHLSEQEMIIRLKVALEHGDRYHLRARQFGCWDQDYPFKQLAEFLWSPLLRR